MISLLFSAAGASHLSRVRRPAVGLLLLLLLLLPACSAQFTRARYVASQSLREQGGLVAELRTFAAEQEKQITASSKTQEERDGKVAPFRAAVDRAVDLIQRSGAAMKALGAALGVPDQPPAGVTPP